MLFARKEGFISEEINPEIEKVIYGKSYIENLNIKISDLRYLKVKHCGFDGKDHIGELIINKKLTEEILDIFEELYKLKYKIEKIKLIDYYADDDESMKDNNSSCFCYRKVAVTGRLSYHALGCAIDINPIQNPYIFKNKEHKQCIAPTGSEKYVNRNKKKLGMILINDVCYNTFVNRGWCWGGECLDDKLDYQHFEKKI
ncbi:MAG: M15 family metallopeptidase [Candidatus Paraimprobicoccus trichonymphae]|uniref:M15 family metallopeptidase n=1 Tax=Candidatus Paraimprobicoccus trichonymphae TaxID=3033793 RepID=A0AA48HXA6_9FIRM|nr:MAG: M15 family metallopeptidase [Candidatus Paraimprobicoccus trichonymphae]